MFKNPLNADKDIDSLVYELQKTDSDAKTVAKLYTKILAKGVATGLVISASIALVAGLVVGVATVLVQTEEDED